MAHQTPVFELFSENASVRIPKMFMGWKSFCLILLNDSDRQSVIGTYIEYLRNPGLMVYSRPYCSPSNVITDGLYPTTVRMVMYIIIS